LYPASERGSGKWYSRWTSGTGRCEGGAGVSEGGGSGGGQ
jgi:hypothetical protein